MTSNKVLLAKRPNNTNKKTVIWFDDLPKCFDMWRNRQQPACIIFPRFFLKVAASALDGYDPKYLAFHFIFAVALMMRKVLNRLRMWCSNFDGKEMDRRQQIKVTEHVYHPLAQILPLLWLSGIFKMLLSRGWYFFSSYRVCLHGSFQCCAWVPGYLHQVQCWPADTNASFLRGWKH